MEYAEGSGLHYLEKMGRMKQEGIVDTLRTSNWALARKDAGLIYYTPRSTAPQELMLSCLNTRILI
jgi:hypothetical protein